MRIEIERVLSEVPLTPVRAVIHLELSLIVPPTGQTLRAAINGEVSRLVASGQSRMVPPAWAYINHGIESIEPLTQAEDEPD